MSPFIHETRTTSSAPALPERTAFRTGLTSSLVLHLAMLAVLSGAGTFAVHQLRTPVDSTVNSAAPATREGHEQRTAQAKATLEKLTETLNRLEKIENQEKPAFEKALADAAKRAPSEVVQRLTDATKAQKRVSEALKRGESPKAALATVSTAQERAKRAVSLLTEKAQTKVAPLLSEAEKKQAEALKKADQLAEQTIKRNQPASEAAKKAALAAQRDAEVAMTKALADAIAEAKASTPPTTTTVATAETSAKKPHAPGQHTPSCFAPGGI